MMEIYQGKVVNDKQMMCPGPGCLSDITGSRTVLNHLKTTLTADNLQCSRIKSGEASA